MNPSLYKITLTIIFMIAIVSTEAQVKNKTFFDSVPDHLLPFAGPIKKSILVESPPALMH